MTHSACGKSWLRAALSTSAATSALIAGMTMSVYAQDEAPPAAADEEDVITVTGSRIARPELTANSPVTVVDSEDVTLTGTVNAEELLNEMPQVIPGVDRSSNNPGNGTATVSLRGLGTQRTLVLVNGRRWVPAGLGSTVDINTVPAALIERVEVVTGGASAVYGSDAVAGVVNFILNDKFEGAQLESSYRFTDQGDGGIWDTSLVIGGNFDNGRGNAVFYANHTDRKPLLQGDREFSNVALGDDGAGGFVPLGSSGIPGTRLDAGQEGNFGFPGNGRFEPDGTFVPYVFPDDTYNYAPVNYLQLPQERWTIFGSSRYEVTDWLQAYAEGSYTSSRVPQQLAPTPAFVFADVTIQDAAGFNNPFINPVSIPTLLAADTNGDGAVSTVVRRRLVENHPRISDASLETLLLTGGFKGDLGISDWKFDVYYQYGQVVAPTILSGDASADKFVEGLSIEYANLTGDNDPTNSANWQCTSGNPACVPLNIYGEGNLTPDMVDWFTLTVESLSRNEQTVLNGSVNGSVFTMPTANNPFKVAFGLEYRENAGTFTADTPLANGDVLGFNSAPNTHGRFDVWEVFFEGDLPLVEDRPLVHSLSLQGGWRYSDYSTAGGVTTFKGGGEYAPIPDIRFRGLYQRATRAPNIGELFTPQGNNFPGASDPCSGGGAGANGAFDTYDPAKQAQALAACTALFNGLGLPVGNIGTDIQPNSQIEAIISGNPNLGAETATTWTVGAVIQPRWIENLRLSVDYFDIGITETIAALSAQEVMDLCIFDEGGNPASEHCSIITHFPNGQVDTISTPLLNQAFLNTSGIDLEIHYGTELADLFGTEAPGRVEYDFVGTWTKDWVQQSAEGVPAIACDGAFGFRCGEPTPSYKLTQRLSYRIAAVTLSLRHRWLAAVDDDFVKNEGTCFFTVCTIPAQHYLDLSALWDVTDNVQLTGGFRNLLNNDAPILGDNQEQANTWPATYTPYGTEIFVGSRLKW